MGFRPEETNYQFQEKRSVTPLFDLQELLNKPHGVDYHRHGIDGGVADAATRHVFMLVDRINRLSERKLSRRDNYQWNDRNHYEKMMAESPVGYVVHERLDSFTIDDVLYRFDIIQLSDGIALRVIQDELGTIKERKKKYLERYEGLGIADQEKELNEMVREVLGNFRADLRQDIADALEKATAPKAEEKGESPRQQTAAENQPRNSTRSDKIPSFYDSVIFMGILSQACATRLSSELGLLIFI